MTKNSISHVNHFGVIVLTDSAKKQQEQMRIAAENPSGFRGDDLPPSFALHSPPSWGKGSVRRQLGLGCISYGKITSSLDLKVSVSDLLTFLSLPGQAEIGSSW